MPVRSGEDRHLSQTYLIIGPRTLIQGRHSNVRKLEAKEDEVRKGGRIQAGDHSVERQYHFLMCWSNNLIQGRNSLGWLVRWMFG